MTIPFGKLNARLPANPESRGGVQRPHSGVSSQHQAITPRPFVTGLSSLSDFLAAVR